MESEARLFDSIFNPRSVAIIGASPQDLATLAQMSTKIRDRLFLVNPKYTEVRGKKCYPSLSAVEAGIDYAMLIGVLPSSCGPGPFHYYQLRRLQRDPDGPVPEGGDGNSPVFPGDPGGASQAGPPCGNQHRESSRRLAHILQCIHSGEYRRHHPDRGFGPQHSLPGFSIRSVPVYLRRAMGPGVEAHMKALIDLMMEGCEHARDKERKPVLICVSLDPYLEDEEDRHYNLMIKRAFSEKKFPVYPNLDAAVKTLSYLYNFGQRRLSSPFLS